MRVMQDTHTQFVALHVQNAPPIGIVIPAGVRMPDGDIKPPGLAGLCGSDLFDRRRVGEGCGGQKHVENQISHGGRIEGCWGVVYQVCFGSAAKRILVWFLNW